MSTEELAGCPFCGGTPASQRFGNRDGGASYAVWCDSCHISTAWMHGDDGEQRAIAAWNRRAAPAAGTVKDVDLPPLPRPLPLGWSGGGMNKLAYGYSASQMQKYALAAIEVHNARSPLCSS
jgi:Lar family restriction alleviation protein